ncbi:MAG: hypothetical protein KDA57_03935 [Planctomycetales bacterium]|nr:hypothetical protein [Planctomycetales bacterium]
MSRANQLRSVWLAYVTLACSQFACAHHSPSEVIEALTEQMVAGQGTASLLIRRGDEYRAICDEQSAAIDYQAALELEPGSLPALYGLAHACFRLQLPDKASSACQRAIAVARNPDEAGAFHALLARIREQETDWSQALNEWQKSLESSKPEVDWYLGKARVLSKLDRDQAARDSLEIAIKRNPSVVLQRAWIRSLIHCGAASEASLVIEEGLSRARWKGSWLLLRAQLELSQDKLAAARHDAARALQEIDARLEQNPGNPWLIADRQQVLTILVD